MATQSFVIDGIVGTVNIKQMQESLESKPAYRNNLMKMSRALQAEIIRFTPVDTGALRNSIIPLLPEDAQHVPGLKTKVGVHLTGGFPLIAGVSIGSSSPAQQRADVAPYWAFVEYGTGARGLFTEVKKPIGNPDNWKYGFVNGQVAQAYIRKGIRSFLKKLKAKGGIF